MSTESESQIAIFAGGCFWGVEYIFLKHFPPSEKKGILSTACGYTGGKPLATNPTYEQVRSGETDHAEAVKIEFDPSVVTYEDLVEFFYRTHDPTSVNRQGTSIGTQYRSVIFTTSDAQAVAAKLVTEKIQAKYFRPEGKKIVTEILTAGQWWNAEDYHQLYLFKNPNGKRCPTHQLHW